MTAEEHTDETSANGNANGINETSSSVKNLVEKLSQMTTRSVSTHPNKDRKFWKTQPVPQTADELCGNRELVGRKSEDAISKNCFPLPGTFEWHDVDIEDEKDKAALYALLSANYVEDQDSLFRFDYPAEFLEWALMPPNWMKRLHVGVRTASTQKLVAFISAIPVHIEIDKKEVPMVEVNFLCVHKKLRTKRLSPILIQEITRRVNLYANIFHAVFTTGTVVSQAFSTSQYYHRPLNYPKLVDCRFMSLPPGSSIDNMIKKYDIKCSKSLSSLQADLSNIHTLYPGLRVMNEGDISSVFKLLNNYMSHFRFRPIFTSEAEVAHWLLPRTSLVYSFVVASNENINAMISFYSLPSSVLIPNVQHTTLKTAYSFYYAFLDPSQAEILLVPLMKTIMLIAKYLGFDVFNCLNLLQNNIFLDDLKFGRGDGQLRYYFYNWTTENCPPDQVGLIML